MALHFSDRSERVGLDRILKEPGDWAAKLSLYTNNNTGDPTLGIEQFFIPVEPSLAPRNIIFPLADTDGAGRAKSFADPVIFTIADPIVEPLLIYGVFAFLTNGVDTNHLILWQFFDAPFTFTALGQALTVLVKAYAKDFGGVP